MNKLILANLTHRPVRSSISVIAVAMEVTLILVVVGILLGILKDTNDRNKVLGLMPLCVLQALPSPCRSHRPQFR